MTDIAHRLAVAERAARAGGTLALDRFRDDLTVETKTGKTDVVTDADRDAQARVVEVLTDAYPDEPVVGEEDGLPRSVPETGPAWVVDPIDGTNNYVRGARVWATSVVSVANGDPVAAATDLPALCDTYLAGENGVRRNDLSITVSERTDPETFAVAPTIWWGFDRREEYAALLRGIVEYFGDLRRPGSAHAALAGVASGEIDAALTNVEPNPWDAIGGVHLVRRAGGVVTDVAGEPWHHASRGLVASNGQAHDAVLAAAREAERAREDA